MKNNFLKDAKIMNVMSKRQAPIGVYRKALFYAKVKELLDRVF